MVDDTDIKRATARGLRLSRRCQRILAHQGPNAQGACLVDLVSMYVASHHPALRAQCLDMLVKAVKDMVPASVGELAERGVFPPEWRQ